MELERVVRSPNGEDTLYVYFRWDDGQYVLMPYNAIKKEMAVPIRTNGMSPLSGRPAPGVPRGDGSDSRAPDPGVAHAVPERRVRGQRSHRRIVPRQGGQPGSGARRERRACPSAALGHMAEPSRRLYESLLRELSRFVDAYYWLGHAETGDLLSVVTDGPQDRRSRSSTSSKRPRRFALRSGEALAEAEHRRSTRRWKRCASRPSAIVDTYLLTLSTLRTARGGLVQLREMRSIDLAKVDALDARVREAFDAGQPRVRRAARHRHRVRAVHEKPRRGRQARRKPRTKTTRAHASHETRIVDARSGAHVVERRGHQSGDRRSDRTHAHPRRARRVVRRAQSGPRHRPEQEEGALSR